MHLQVLLLALVAAKLPLAVLVGPVVIFVLIIRLFSADHVWIGLIGASESIGYISAFIIGLSLHHAHVLSV